MYGKVFCNNCDKFGHTFHSCRKPLISSGIIAFRLREDGKTHEFLTVCRKHTFGYIDFLRGRYAINNKTHILDIFYEMTENEKGKILSNDFDTIWLELWGSSDTSYYKNEMTFAREKFNMLAKGIFIKDSFYNTKIIIEECKNNWVIPEWGFPKGRKNMNESNKECAIREWCEESGFRGNQISLLSNINSFNEYVIGSNYHSYRDTFFIGEFSETKLDKEMETINYQKSEISDAKWASLEELKALIRPYHKERLNMITNINSLLEKWSLI
jgi:8-oxo-dGTP pyrophosphatase MutT (NUDIX family)